MENTEQCSVCNATAVTHCEEFGNPLCESCWHEHYENCGGCQNHKIVCSECGEIKDDHAYCDEDGSAFCSDCWGNHLEACSKCNERH